MSLITPSFTNYNHTTTYEDIVYIDYYRDPVTQREVSFWDDTVTVFDNAVHVRYKAKVLPFLTRSDFKILKPRRIAALPDVTLVIIIDDGLAQQFDSIGTMLHHSTDIDSESNTRLQLADLDQTPVNAALGDVAPQTLLGIIFDTHHINAIHSVNLDTKHTEEDIVLEGQGWARFRNDNGNKVKPTAEAYMECANIKNKQLKVDATDTLNETKLTRFNNAPGGVDKVDISETMREHNVTHNKNLQVDVNMTLNEACLLNTNTEKTDKACINNVTLPEAYTKDI
ncbi:hypothetical protein FBU30_005624 [Linnemannia zychae]|nr:hypothetical protein FBU30_005624 [Linnemannia zychae]